jgi:heme/copper-type cytochrome/quinol oxidase subunit 1
MDNKISTFHRIILWIALITCIPFGLGNYLVPKFVTSIANVKAPDLISVACIGGFLIAGFVGRSPFLKIRPMERS